MPYTIIFNNFEYLFHYRFLKNKYLLFLAPAPSVAGCAARAAFPAASRAAISACRVSNLFGTVFPSEKDLSISACCKVPKTVRTNWACSRWQPSLVSHLFQIHLESVSPPYLILTTVDLRNCLGECFCQHWAHAFFMFFLRFSSCLFYVVRWVPPKGRYLFRCM